MANPPTNRMRLRMFIVAICMCVVACGVLVVQLFRIQILDQQFYQQLATAQQMRTTTIPARRGTIYDANGKILAKSGDAWTVFISPVDIKNEEELALIASGLSEILDVSADKIIELGRKKESYYQIVKARLEKPLADEVTAFASKHKISAINLELDTKRYYPYGNFAAKILGFVNSNGGAYGLEAYYDKTLSGTPGRVLSLKNARGTDTNIRQQQMNEAVPGNSLVLTIDESIQHFVEKHLATAVAEHHVKNRAVGIVMDVNTGAVLAMCDKPDFDPNDPQTILDAYALAALDSYENKNSEEYQKAFQEALFTQWLNKAITEPYEPGSVFKIITASGAVEAGAVTLNSTFSCPGYIEVNGRRIHCWRTTGHGHQDFEAAMRNSCNPAFVTIGMKMGAHDFYKNFDGFGLTGRTGIDLPGEATSIYHSESILAQWGLASSSFGQTFKVTPLQMITAVSAAVNGGYLYEPYLVQQVLDPNGNVVSTTKPNLKRQVVSEETSALIAYLCEKVVTEGSGHNAYIPGYRIGGKTGTSEKIGPGESGNILSFVGFAPADQPQIAVLVLLDEPSLTNAYGSTIAAPVVGAIMADVLPYMGIEPKYTDEEVELMDITTPNVVSKGPHEAQIDLTKAGLKTKILGEGGSVIAQIPMSGQPIPKGGTVILFTDAASTQDSMVTVPDVVGLSGQRANLLITNAGLNIRVVGMEIDRENIIAVKQSHQPGTKVYPGTVITVDFVDQSVTD